MALVVKDRVQETSTTTGTGTLTLLGAVTGYQTFSSAIGNTNTTYYAITNGSEWEVGLGTVGAGTLSRDTVLESSNSGSLVNFSSGAKNVFCTYPAEKSLYLDASGNAINLGAASVTSLSDSGNLTFTGTGNRITGDMSNATVGNRIMFQTSTSSTFTSVGIIPSAASNTSALDCYNTNDPANASRFSISCTSADARLITTLNGTGSYLPMTFYTGGSERMRIDTSGNVGIGTSSPAQKLDVTGAVNSVQARFGNVAGRGLELSTAILTGTNDAISVLNAKGGTKGTLVFQTDTTERMRIDSSGNVGIGTSSPSTKLQVNDTITIGTADKAIQWLNSGTALADIRADSSSNLIFRNTSSYTERMRIDSSGNLSFNSGYGSAAIAYGCRAWAKFTSTTTPSISASGNIASVTYSATAQYTIAFTSAMPDANYAVVTGGNYNNAAGNYTYGTSIYSQSTTSFVIQTWTAGTPAVWNASGFVYFSVFR